MKKNYIQFPLNWNFTYIVLGIVVLTILLFTRLQFFYNYDEVIVYTISQQSLPQFFETIKAEPHPPGFYLLLHFLSAIFSTQIGLKSAVNIISVLLFLYAIRYAQSKNILDKYKLNTGLILFISSFTFLTVISHLKQDSVTAPIFILLFFSILHSWNSNESTWKKFLLPTLLQLVLLSFGYISFVFGTILLWGNIALQFKIKKASFRQIFPMFSVSMFIILFYFFSFGFEQIRLNQGRFDWSAFGDNSFFSAISLHISGFLPSHPIHAISVGVFMFFIFSTLYEVHTKHISPKLFTTILGISGLLTLLYYFTELFVQARYGVFLFFFLSIVAGWGVDFIISNRVLKSIFLFSVFIFALSNFLIFEQIDRNSWLMKVDLVQATLRDHPDQSFGLLFDHSLYPHILKLQYFPNNPQLKPLNISASKDIFESTQITQSHLRLDANNYKNVFESQIQQVLQSSKTSNYIYIANQTKYQTHFTDPNQTLLKHLTTYCTLSKQQESSIHIIYVFLSCHW